MFKAILVAFDGSENSSRAFEAACDLALKYGSKLFVVHVVDTLLLNAYSTYGNVGFTHPQSFELPRLLEALGAQAQSDIDSCVKLAKEKGIDAYGNVLEGDPATEIINHSEKVKADLIVTGHRGMSTWKRLLMGSVSYKVVSESKMATLVVK